MSTILTTEHATHQPMVKWVEGYAPKEYATQGKANAALTTGIIGTAAAGLSLLGGNGLGGLIGGNTAQSEQFAAMAAKNAYLESKDFTTQSVLDLYKNQTAEFRERDKELVASRIAEATQAAEIKCLNEKVVNNTARIAVLEKEACDNRVNVAVMGSNITALAADTKAAISLEAERRECGDNRVFDYGVAHYVPGTLLLKQDQICK